MCCMFERHCCGSEWIKRRLSDQDVGGCLAASCFLQGNPGQLCCCQAERIQKQQHNVLLATVPIVKQFKTGLKFSKCRENSNLKIISLTFTWLFCGLCDWQVQGVKFQAPTAEEKDAWIKALCDAISRAKNKVFDEVNINSQNDILFLSLLSIYNFKSSRVFLFFLHRWRLMKAVISSMLLERGLKATAADGLRPEYTWKRYISCMSADAHSSTLLHQLQKTFVWFCFLASS